MEGYILINEIGQRLTFVCHWSFDHEGYIWSEKERDMIIEKSIPWAFRPIKYIPARLERGHVVLTGEPVKIRK